MSDEGRQEGSISTDSLEKEPGTARLYMTISPLRTDGHGTVLFWAENPHTFDDLKLFVEEHIDKFIFRKDATPVLICLNVDHPIGDLSKESIRRIDEMRNHFFSIPERVKAATRQ